MDSPRERTFAQYMTDLFAEARWFIQGSGFANGKPLNEQVPLRASILLMFVEAIKQAQNRKEEKAPPKDNPHA